MVIDTKILIWDGDRTEIAAYFNDTDEKYLHVGTYDQFQEWITVNEDLSDYIEGYDMDKDDVKPDPIYWEYFMDDFMSPDYYLPFYEHQKKLGLTKIITFDFDDNQFVNQPVGSGYEPSPLPLLQN